MRCLCPISVKNPKTGRYHDVPCGSCYNCLSNKRNGWSLRCHFENVQAKQSFFITLTYADGYTDGNVSKSDIQKFIHDLRKRLDPVKLRYYIISEYGPTTFRPHYHGLIWLDSDVSTHDFLSYLELSWNKGFINVGNVDDASIHYCTSYCINKEDNIPGLEPVFCLMSRNPGIGAILIRSKIIMQDGKVKWAPDPDKLKYWNVDNCYMAKDGYKFSLPRFYRDNIYSSSQKELMELKRKKRDLENPPLKDSVNIAYDPESSEFYRRKILREFTKHKKL